MASSVYYVTSVLFPPYDTMISQPILDDSGSESASLDENEKDVDVKGKAVIVLHTWKDALWDMGSSKKVDPPAPRTIQASPDSGNEGSAQPGGSAGGETSIDVLKATEPTPGTSSDAVPTASNAAAAPEDDGAPTATLTPEGQYSGPAP